MRTASGKRDGKFSTVYRCFSRWSKEGRWEAIFQALQEPELEYIMIDSSVVRAHQHAAGQKKSSASDEALRRSRDGFTTKIHAAVDAYGNPLTFIVPPGQAGDCPQAKALLQPYEKESITAVLMGRGYNS